ncbi:twin-arginine translocation pathway signal [Rhodopseudomonas sp.]|uniref:twin-arginine translocation pathway signal n=1 Tax=Rhodopseudomonas sp. TaxID=1078 RepID=UPI003B3B96A9
MTISFRLTRFAILGAGLLAGAGLSGCAAIGDSAVSQAFVDPARYELYNCEQLAAERKSLDARLADLDGLMRKAETGVAGSVVSEVAYRNDYINVKAQSRLAEQTWRDNKCTEPAAPAAAPAGAKPPRAKR